MKKLLYEIELNYVTMTTMYDIAFMSMQQHTTLYNCNIVPHRTYYKGISANVELQEELDGSAVSALSVRS
jgi:hypothetical protein